VGVDVVAMVARTLVADIPCADQAGVGAVLRDVAGLRRWLDGVEVACAQRLEQLAASCPSLFPEQIAAQAARSGLRHGARAAARARTAATVAELGEALAAGEIAGEHVDAVTAGLRDLTAPQQAVLAGKGEMLALAAGSLTPDEFRRQVAKIVRGITADDGIARLERQKRAVRLRAWIDRVTGMLRLSGELDPEEGVQLLNKLNAEIEALFHDRTPDRCPDDPSARQDFLRAHALLHLINAGGGTGSGGWKTEMTIVIDHDTIVHGPHPRSRTDCGVDGVDLPVDVLRRMALFADIIPVLLDEDGVVLKMGRTRRLATRAQRQALRAMYRHCAIPGCRTPVRHCTPHHCDEWDHGGLTDIDDLVPICKSDHAMIHTKGWTLSLSADRRLTITTPDGTTMTTGPPSEQWQ
jgi:hypothetical protein